MHSRQTKLVVVHHVSNVLASVLPVDQVVSWAHDVGAKVLVDACQSVPNMEVDVESLDADFLVASSHIVKFFPHVSTQNYKLLFEVKKLICFRCVGLQASDSYMVKSEEVWTLRHVHISLESLFWS